MFRLKLSIVILFCGIAAAACLSSRANYFSIGESKAYEASLFRQNCAVCHGPEGQGQTLDTGVIVPSLRSGNFKAKSKAEILKQITEGGNGMLPFRLQLTTRELEMMADFVHDDLRRGEKGIE